MGMEGVGNNTMREHCKAITEKDRMVWEIGRKKKKI
jgi:hypothetical protein